MPTVAEVLKQSGFTEEQIAAIDARAITAFSGVLTTAEQKAAEAAQKAQEAAEAFKKAETEKAAALQAKDAAELEKRSVTEFWETKVNPGLLSWEQERNKLAKEAADAAAEAAFYKAQREGYLKSLNIDPANAPEFKPAVVDPNNPPRNDKGQFVPGPTGSPVFDTNTVISKVGDGMNTIQNIMWKYQSLYGGQPLPIPPSELIAKADQLKLSPMEYAARTFKFAEKEEEQRQAVAKAHDDQIAAAASAAKEAEWKAKLDAREKEFAAKEKLLAERGGNNPDVRTAISSNIPELQRKVNTKELPDPLLMNEAQRRANTAKMIRETIANKEQVVA